MSSFAEASRRVVPPDPAAATAARAHHDRLTKPPGSLGRLEDLGVQLSAIAGRCPPPLAEPAVVAVFSADHGVLDEGISPWPQEVTAQMVANFASGGAAVSVLARRLGVEVVVVDVGVVADLPPLPGLRQAKVRRGTANLATGPAMTEAEASTALDVGAALATELVDAGARCLLTGDMGIGNTTPSAALIAALCGRPATEVTGRGTGIDDRRMARKVGIVEAAAARVTGASSSPLQTLASIGGLEIAALAGFIVGGASCRVPVVLDGVIAAAAAVVARALVPDAVGYLVAGHRSTEPGATAALEHLGLVPVLDLGLRLGEGTGACLALPVVQAAAAVLGEMATFDAAGVSEGPGGVSP